MGLANRLIWILSQSAKFNYLWVQNALLCQLALINQYMGCIWVIVIHSRHAYAQHSGGRNRHKTTTPSMQKKATQFALMFLHFKRRRWDVLLRLYLTGWQLHLFYSSNVNIYCWKESHIHRRFHNFLLFSAWMIYNNISFFRSDLYWKIIVVN